jgi:HEAT repeat protein
MQSGLVALGALLLAGVVAAQAADSQPATQPTGPVRLGELPALAKARAARQRPAQQAALQPFLQDLTLNYAENQEFLDRRLGEIVQLGDAIVPLLLEMLSPADDSQGARYLASNCAHVLRQMDPGAFVDALLEILEGRNHVARYHAIALLGYSKSRNAAHRLSQILPLLKDGLLVRAIDSLSVLGAPEATPSVIAVLQNQDRFVRRAALEFLAACQASEGIDAALQAMAAEKNPTLLPAYTAYFAAAAKGHAAAADALLPLLSGEQLDKEQVTALVQSLATIAPEGHAGTLQALRQILQQDETGALGRAAALTMRDLGDKKGLQVLFANLDTKVNRRKKDSLVWSQRGDAWFAIGKWAEATRDYEAAIENTKSPTLQSFLHTAIAKCEARRGRWPRAQQALKDAGLTYEAALKEIERDEPLRKGMDEKSFRKFVESLPRENRPR